MKKRTKWAKERSTQRKKKEETR